MNITQQKIDEVNVELKIEVLEDDYALKVDQILKDYQKKHDIKGFRPGKTPFSLIKKMYGKGVLADEVNKMVYDKIFKYLDQNHIEVLGQPIPNREKADLLNLGDQKDFTLYYDLGLAPQFDYGNLEDIEIDFYSIKVSEQDIDKYVNDIRRRYGKFSSPEVSTEHDLIYVELTELDETGNIIVGGITNKTSISIDLIKKDAGKQKFIGLKKDDTIDINLIETIGDEKEISLMLAIDQTKVAGLNKPFRLTVIEINHVELADLDEELLRKVYQNENITSEEQLRERIRFDAQSTFNGESDKRFVNDVLDAIFEKSDIHLPDEFLKRFLFETNKNKHSFQEIEAQYGNQADALRFQLIESKIFKDNNVSITEESVKDYYKDYFRTILQPNENGEYPEDKINDFTNHMMEKKEETERIMEVLSEAKLKEIFKNRIKKTVIETSYEDFIKLAAAKQTSMHTHDHDHHDHDHHNHDHHDHDHDHHDHDHDHHDHKH
jgi:trigger factor